MYCALNGKKLERTVNDVSCVLSNGSVYDALTFAMPSLRPKISPSSMSIASLFTS